MLGPRGSSVFPAPIREILNVKSYEQSNSRCKRLTGKGLSRQTYGIVPKIRDVDELLQSNREIRKTVREAHPEICFFSLSNGFPMNYNKKTPEGFKERFKILNSYWEPSEEALSKAFLWCGDRNVARDDIVDALVLAVTATHSREDQISIPREPPDDDTGLPMQMIHLSFKESRRI
jgi:predicted RNase H-like nuclease